MNDAVGNEMVFNITDIETLAQKFKKLAKRAAKLGVEAPDYTITGSHKEFEVVLPGAKTGYVKEVKHFMRLTGLEKVVHHVVLSGAKEVKLDGWKFIAVLDHELGSDNVIIRSMPGVNSVLRVVKDTHCDHCKRASARKTTYVLRHEDGRQVQVGSTCIRDFLGHSVEGILASIDIETVAREILEETSRTASGEECYTLVEYLAWVAKDIRENGWNSKKDVMDGRAESATAYRALGALRAHVESLR